MRHRHNKYTLPNAGLLYPKKQTSARASHTAHRVHALFFYFCDHEARCGSPDASFHAMIMTMTTAPVVTDMPHRHNTDTQPSSGQLYPINKLQRVSAIMRHAAAPPARPSMP